MRLSRIKELLPLVGMARYITEAPRGIGQACHTVVRFPNQEYSQPLCGEEIGDFRVVLTPNKKMCSECSAISRELQLIYNNIDCQRVIFWWNLDKENPKARNPKVNIAPKPVEETPE